MKKFLFVISHPAHYHMFKYVLKGLADRGHQVQVVIRPKDVLEQLCGNDGLNYIRLADRPPTGNLFALAWSLVKKDVDMLSIVRTAQPDLLLGSDGTIARVGTLLGIPSIEFSEDDARAIKLYALSSYSFFSHILSPEVTDAWLWSGKKVSYNGFQKLAYLHPRYFKPDQSVLKKYGLEDPYFIIRLSALTAYHDVGESGFQHNKIGKLVSLLELHGKVYITSEGKMDERFKKFELKIHPSDLHQVLYFASMLIGDSQSMTVEAALSGVPSFRLSSFVGKLSVLEELEQVYNLTYGFKPSDFDKMLDEIKELLKMDGYRSVFNTRRQQLLAEKIDVTSFYLWFIENYPESVKIMRENPDYQYTFR